MKSIFKSKTFWVNALVMASTVGGILPPKYAAIVLPVANVGLRLISSQGTYVIPPTTDGK